MKDVVDIEDPTKMTQIDDDYFSWLISQISIPNNKRFDDLFERMHSLEFVWFVPNDDNRLQDGLDLRSEFLDGTRKRLFNRGASTLEVLVALSRRVAFTAGGDASTWAWRLIRNLRLNKMTDPLTTERLNKVEEILYALVWRTYHHSGQGGFFPLKNPKEDQTKIEIWYQMNLYVNEMHGF